MSDLQFFASHILFVFIFSFALFVAPIFSLPSIVFASCWDGNDFNPNQCLMSDSIEMYEDGSYTIL